MLRKVGDWSLKILFYLLLIAIILLLAFLLKNKNVFITIICSLIIVQIILAPKVCIDGAVTGALLFFYKVFPSLFSFLVVSNIILCYDGVYIYSKLLGNIICKPLRLPNSCSFVLIISVLCGYPLGAKYACDLYERNIIDLETCERLLNIASNSSPLFVLGSVGISMLNSSYIGYIMLLSNMLSCIAMGFLIPAKKICTKNVSIQNHTYANMNIGNVLKNSVENSVKTCLSIGGFVTIFSVVNNIFKSNYMFNELISKVSHIFGISSKIVEAVTLGVIEMTNGCSLISASDAPLTWKIAIVSFIFTFSGLSIISQVYSFTYKFNISIKKYTIRKVFQGLVCSVISVLLYNLYSYRLYEETFLSYYTNTGNLGVLFIFTLVILILPWLLFKIRDLFHIP